MLSIEGRAVHSRHDPEREAERQLIAEAPDLFGPARSETRSVLVLVNPGLNYLAAQASRINPSCRVVSLYTHAEAYRSRVYEGAVDILFDDETAMLAWLNSVFPLLILRHLRFLIHPVMSVLEPERHTAIRTGIRSLVLVHQRQTLTQGYFSTRYPSNLSKNTRRTPPGIEELASWRDCGGRIPLIAASGPSLRDSLPTLRDRRDRIFLIALPSSIGILDGFGIAPDAIVTIDPGYWAGVQLFRIPREWRCGIWAALTADTGASLAGGREIGFFSQATPLERAAADSNEETGRLITVPETGTVAAAAIELALRRFGPPVLVAGMDLGIQFFMSHVHPHTFYPIHLAKAGRCSPVEYRLCEAGLQTAVGGLYGRSMSDTASLSHYRDWFDSRRARWNGAVFAPKTSFHSAGLDTIDNIDSFVSSAAVQNSAPLGRFIEPSYRRLHDSAVRLEALSTEIALILEDQAAWTVRALTSADPALLFCDDFLRQTAFLPYKRFLSGLSGPEDLAAAVSNVFETIGRRR